MKKVFVLFTALIFTFQAFGTAFAAAPRVLPASRTTQLAAGLPASDAVITFDMLRLTKEAMPQALASRPQILGDINAKFDEIKSRIGIDLRQFEQVAVGVSYKQISATETDYEPVILARGNFNSGAFLGAAKIAASGKYREEKVGDKTVYIFSPKEVMQGKTPQTSNSQANSIIDRLTKSFVNEIALTNFDNNTLAIGTTARIKDALSSKPRVSRELLDLATRQPRAVMSFAGNTPAGISQFVKIDMDEIGKNLDSIRQIYGALDFSDGNAAVAAAARTTDAKQAEDLEQMMNGLQMIGKIGLSGARGADKQVYVRLIENVKIVRQTNEVALNLQIPQTDVDALLGILIK